MRDDPPADAIPDAAVLDAFDLAPARSSAQPRGSSTPPGTSAHAAARLVLQRVNPIFPAEVNLDIAAVTRHLAAKGLLTPMLVPSRDGALWFEHDGVWRVLTRIEGITRDALECPRRRAKPAACSRSFIAPSAISTTSSRTRGSACTTLRGTCGACADALASRSRIATSSAIRPLAERVLAAAARLPALPPMRDRIVHGDPKISNVMFAPDGRRALCLIDLDTLARMPVVLELGDALRSWCNPATEDATRRASFGRCTSRPSRATRTRRAALLEPAEWGAIPEGTVTITVELAARFCADALRESYFRWDERRYASASAHNQARTRGQLQIAEGLLAELPALREITARAFG